MTLQALVWATVEAPDVPTHCLAVLQGLANHAKEDGRDAYPSVELLSYYARKSERAVARDLAELEERGLIRRGDQRAAFRIPAQYRPTVWDLAVERKRDAYVPRRLRGESPPEHPSSPVAGVSAGAASPDVGDAAALTPTSPEPVTEPSTQSDLVSHVSTAAPASPAALPVRDAPRPAARPPLPRPPLPRSPLAEVDPVPRPPSGPPAELGGPGHAAWRRARAALACSLCDRAGFTVDGVACSHPRRDDPDSG